ncbi:MAG TPA: biotin--[acetyl-CoA-carboxylase] ligase, partial [Salinimicrobium sp.]|nr:biotin--[acetyl-CoA-carboxylase] ligase [Salinimicrobium sp.]
EEILHGLMHEVENALLGLSPQASEEIMNSYKKQLFRIHVPSTFQLPDKSLFTGIIQDISENGKLIVQMENELLKEFDLKEIKMMI